jgi:hypothetical protein
VTRDRPPPPIRLKATKFSMATSHTYMAVSAAEAVSKTSPFGLHVTLVTSEWCGLCSTAAQLVEGRVTTEFGSTCHTNTPPSQPTASSDADIGLGSDNKELNVCMEWICICLPLINSINNTEFQCLWYSQLLVFNNIRLSNSINMGAHSGTIFWGTAILPGRSWVSIPGDVTGNFRWQSYQPHHSPDVYSDSNRNE